MGSLSLRVDDGALTRRAEQAGLSRTQLARRYVDEGLRMDAHPGIVFRDGPAGRRAALAGGADVWQVVEVAKGFAGQAPAAALAHTAEWLGVHPTLVRTAIGYYAAYRDEIEMLIRRNAEAFTAGYGEL
jgi:hypothetical protein